MVEVFTTVKFSDKVTSWLHLKYNVAYYRNERAKCLYPVNVNFDHEKLYEKVIYPLRIPRTIPMWNNVYYEYICTYIGVKRWICLCDKFEYKSACDELRFKNSSQGHKK